MTTDRTPDEVAAQQADADEVAALAVELTGRPLTAAQRRMADRAAAVARRLEQLERKRKAGIR